MVRPEDVLALIQRRRSIFPKDYTGAAPPRAHVEAMLEAARWAPTHGKTEPWRFAIISGDARQEFSNLCTEIMKDKLGSESPAFEKYLTKQERKRKDKAKVAHFIAIGMKRKANPEKVMPEWEEIAATACAVQNMHLVATAYGVASYWSSGGPIDDVRILDYLGLSKDDGDRCLGLFHVGMADPARVAAYRAKRSSMADGERVRWIG